MEQIKRYYPNLDIVKWICALFVIAIHISPLDGTTNTWAFWVDPVLIRLAVPLFFTMSGMGLFGKFEYENGRISNCKHNQLCLRQYLLNIIRIYVGWSFVYFVFSLPGWYETGWWGWTLVKDYISAFFFHGSYYHLWYLVVLLYAVPMLFAVLHIIPKKRLLFLMIPLWIVECLLTSYSWLGIDNFPAISSLINAIPCPIHAIFRGMPLLAVGFVAEDYSRNMTARTNGILAVIFGLLYVAEAAAIYFNPLHSSGGTYLFSTPIFLFFLLRFLRLSRQICSEKTGKIFRYGSTMIYCIHPLIIHICQAFVSVVQQVQWALVTIVSALIGLGYGLYKWNHVPHLKK